MDSANASIETPNGADSGPFAPLRAADLTTAAAVRMNWLWHGYLAPGEVTLLTSQWKTGKSTLLAVLLARMRAGGELAGLPLRAGRAIVVSEESPAMWAERNQCLSFGDHVTWFCRPFLGKPRTEDWLALLNQIGRLHDRQPADLVVIDPLANLAPLKSENDAGEMLNALLPLQRLTTRGMSALVQHHPRKGAVVPGQAARGSGALSGYVDIIIEMQRVSTRNLKDRRRRLMAYSRHDATPPCRVIELTADGTDYRCLGESGELDFEHGWPLLQAFLAQAEGPLTRRQIYRNWTDCVVQPAKMTLWKWLDRAVREGLVLCQGMGTRREPYSYHLPGMELQWQAQFLESFNKRLSREGLAGPEAGQFPPEQQGMR